MIIAIFGGCVAVPRPACLVPIQGAASQLEIKRDVWKGPAGDTFQWRWSKGADVALADFGDPSAGDGVALCVYQSAPPAPALLFRADIAGAGSCGTRPCWLRAGTKGWKFASRTPNADGISGVTLTSGVGGRAKLQVKGRGANLSLRTAGLPRMPFGSSPLTVQLHSRAGACFGARFEPLTADKNRAEEFSGRGQ